MTRRFLSTTLGQIGTIIAISSALTFLLFVGLFSILYPGAPPAPPWPWLPAYRIAALVDGLRAVQESQRPALVAAFRRRGVSSIGFPKAPVACGGEPRDARELAAVLRDELHVVDSDIVVRACDPSDQQGAIQVLVTLPETVLEIRLDKVPASPMRLSFPFVTALLFLCVAVAGMSAWAVSRVIRPLSRLAERADAFGRDILPEPINEEGPVEIRRAARAFNLMQQRITRSLQERTRMLAALSHDLRTPLTRMRLQIELGRAEEKAGKLLRDISLMDAMVGAALAYLSGRSEAEPPEWLDLAALLSTLADEYEEQGAAISYDGTEPVRLYCRPNAIARALTNLIENAVHYGKTVYLSAAARDGIITIEVADDGPGIPSERRQDVLQPFVRLDPSRSDRPGSVGLGLSIVREIAESHGGVLELAERPPHGLVARLQLPQCAAQTPASAEQTRPARLQARPT